MIFDFDYSFHKKLRQFFFNKYRLKFADSWNSVEKLKILRLFFSTRKALYHSKISSNMTADFSHEISES